MHACIVYAEFAELHVSVQDGSERKPVPFLTSSLATKMECGEAADGYDVTDVTWRESGEGLHERA